MQFCLFSLIIVQTFRTKCYLLSIDNTSQM
nr:MAG TPA: hypothetical protein [Caudoviricetes sp.]